SPTPPASPTSTPSPAPTSTATSTPRSSSPTTTWPPPRTGSPSSPTPAPAPTPASSARPSSSRRAAPPSPPSPAPSPPPPPTPAGAVDGAPHLALVAIDDARDKASGPPGDSEITVHLGDGAGGFPTRKSQPLGHWLSGVAIVDLDGDARLDLAVVYDLNLAHV